MPAPTSGNLRPTGSPVPTEDASSQALNEALGSSLLLVRVMAVVLAAAFVFSCVFTVNPNEVAVVLRFGKPVGTGSDQVKRQGLHWAFPYPIDEIVRIPIGESKVIRASGAWYAVSPEEEAAGITPQGNPSLTPGVDGHVITSDGNILHVRATLRYKIVNPITYGFSFSNVTNLLRNTLDNSIHWAAVRYTADDALYKERVAFRDSIRQRASELIERHQIGVSLDTLDVEVAAPLFLKTYFDAVTAAEQDRSKRINEAQGEYDRVTREAEGEAKRARDVGLGLSNSLMQAVSADAQFFEQQLPEFRRNPALLRERLRIAAIGRVLTNAQDKFFQPPSVEELRLNLSREPEGNPKRPDQPAR
jgi:membrane protease subunit HflK